MSESANLQPETEISVKKIISDKRVYLKERSWKRFLWGKKPETQARYNRYRDMRQRLDLQYNVVESTSRIVRYKAKPVIIEPIPFPKPKLPPKPTEVYATHMFRFICIASGEKYNEPTQVEHLISIRIDKRQITTQEAVDFHNSRWFMHKVQTVRFLKTFRVMLQY